MDLDFGLARIKEEGAPAHPEDIYIHCGCVKCEEKWQKQLKAYNEWVENGSQRKKREESGGSPS